MDHVSLLPPEIKQARLDKRRQGVMIKILLLLFIIVMAVYAFLLVSSILSRRNLNALRDDRMLVEAQAAELQEYEDLYNNMTAAEERLNTAMGTSPPWGDFLYDIGMAMPQGTVWLSDMSFNYSDESGSFNMRGWAYHHSGVADMLDRIYELEQLDDVLCQFSSETDYQGSEAVQFTVDAAILAGPYFAGDGEPAEVPVEEPATENQEEEQEEEEESEES